MTKNWAIKLRFLGFKTASNGLIDVYQSAYKKQHCIEPAVLHAANTLLFNADKRNVSVLSLLRLPAGFYALDHQIFVCWLQATFGIYNTANDRFSPDMACVLSFWFRFKILTSQVRCPPVLGTVLFTRYTRPLWTLNTTEIITSMLEIHNSKTMLLPA